MEDDQRQERVLEGQSLSPGIAIGKPFFLNQTDFPIFEWSLNPSDAEREIERYREALYRSRQDIKRLQRQLEIESTQEGSLIFEAQLEMLHDPLLTIEIERHIRATSKNAEFVFQNALLTLQEKFDTLKDEFFAERFKELKDVSNRVFGHLRESSHYTLKNIPSPSIVCTIELSTSDAAEAQTHRVQAFISEIGGATSHAAIVAKARGIPFITQINVSLLRNYHEQTIIIDGETGKIFLNPSSETIKRYQCLIIEREKEHQQWKRGSLLPAKTLDGHTVRLLANLERVQDLDLVRQVGSEGIGLFRSEYLLLGKTTVPSEEEQFQIYAEIVKNMASSPVVIRTFDFSGDKAELPIPALVGRIPSSSSCKIRFLLEEEKLLETQIRAILRASEYGNVSVLFPMISTLEEWRMAKTMALKIKSNLKMTHKVRLGCMMEVPSVAVLADQFVKECDFLSIGTNDLVQYTMAIDRRDSMSFYKVSTDPSLLRLIKFMAQEANRAKVPITVCGEMASDSRFTALLLGLGIYEFSVSPRFLPLIKQAIRNLHLDKAIALAQEALSLTTAEEIFALLSRTHHTLEPI